MELELKKECLDTYEPGEPQTLTQEETTETIVPDYCPDIARIISAEGAVYLHGGAEQEGLSGTVRVTVLYTPENETGVRALEFALPFTAQGEGLSDCTHVAAETEIELLESRMLNPRKIFTRCNAGDASDGVSEGMPVSLVRRGDIAGTAGGKALLRTGSDPAAADCGKGSDLLRNHVPVSGPGRRGRTASLPHIRDSDGDERSSETS